MLNVKKEGIVLTKTNLPFEEEGVLNPAAIREGDGVHLFYRAVQKGNFSTVGYCYLTDPLLAGERWTKPMIAPEHDYEVHGIEDPRVVKIDDLYYLTYTAYDGVNAMGALATSTDLRHWTKQGIIVPQFTFDEFKQMAHSEGMINEKYLRYNSLSRHAAKEGQRALVWDKNVIFFPRRINGKLFFLHRIKPDIQIVSFDELTDLTPQFWETYFMCLDDCIALAPKYDHEVSYLGGGCPPIETAEGWLLIYHAVHDTVKGYVYTACAALLDLQRPGREIARLPRPLFGPEFEWELKGEVNNVCFPTGAALFGDTLYIYYGAADERIACASISLAALLAELLRYPATDNSK